MRLHFTDKGSLIVNLHLVQELAKNLKHGSPSARSITVMIKFCDGRRIPLCGFIV